MLEFINVILVLFEPCFTRDDRGEKVVDFRTFTWFVMIVIGFMIRPDTLGVTSFVRALGLCSFSYPRFIGFFNSKLWTVDSLVDRWVYVVAQHAPIFVKANFNVLIGDHTKVSKEGFYIPCLGRHYQESETVSKGEHIHGHCWETIGIAIGNPMLKLFSLPLISKIAAGIEELRTFDGNAAPSYSMAVQPIADAYKIALLLLRFTGRCSVVLLDRYFLSVAGLKLLDQLNASGQHALEIITKVKRGFVFYDDPPEPTGKRGRTCKKGASHDVFDVFNDPDVQWTTATLFIYGKYVSFEYCVLDRLWGKTLYKKMRFVFVRNYPGMPNSVLVSTSLSLTGLEIIEFYAYRHNIENFFREFKQNLAGLGYHFWCKALEKYSHFAKKTDPSPMSKVEKKNQHSVVNTMKRIEGYVMLASIAMGILQMIALRPDFIPVLKEARYIRIPEGIKKKAQSQQVVSESSVMYYIKLNFFRLLQENPDLEITKRINRCLKLYKTQAA